VCSVLYRPYLRRYPALPVGVYAMAAAVVFLAVWAAFEGLGTRLGQLSASAWAAVLFIGVTSGGGYFLWLWALRHASASRVSLFLALSPLTAIALGGLWLGEAATPQLWFAFVLVFAGLVVARDEQR
jgi:drug/metabolite transporter (DMT)-like permease